MAAKYNVKVQYAAWMAVVTLATVVTLVGVTVMRDWNARSAAAQKRAALSARAVAQALAPGLATNQSRVTDTVALGAVPDAEIFSLRVVNAANEPIFAWLPEQRPAELLLATAPVVVRSNVFQVKLVHGQSVREIETITNVAGYVEVGLGQASVVRETLETILIGLGIGMLLVGAGVAVSFYASGPVRASLKQLQQYVQKVARGQGRGERLESDLAEVDQVGRTLTEVVLRVEDGQARLKKAQQELKAAQKEMDEYTYVISHDLKEPLRGIEGFSKLLSDGYREKLDDNGRHYVDTIRNSTLRMQRLIGDLLKFSRLSQQKNPMTPVGLNAMLMHVRLNLQYALDQKHAELHVNRLPTVICDATAMTEVFHNLISNAIKYNDKPLPVIEVSCEEKSHPETGLMEYVFMVRDNGVGIKREYFDKIFQIFQRLQRDEEGTGIGLTIVRRVIEWHGGRIWLESEENQGTTFYFTLPKRESNKSGTIMELPKTATQTGGPVAQTV
jgi:signal transduction histidine kinase